MTPPPPDPVDVTGKRLAALREALGLKQQDVADASAELERKEPAKYHSMGRSYIANQERKGVAHADRARVTFAAIFGLDREQFARYLAGDLEIEDVLEIRRSRTSASPAQAAAADDSGVPRLRQHREWADLCARAMQIDPGISPATLRALGEKAFLYGEVDSLDVHFLVDLARGYQSWRRRTGP